MASIAQCTVDVVDLDLMARFWSAALGYTVDADGAHLRGAPGQPSLYLQRVESVTPGKRAVHLDLRPDGTVEEEVARLIALGATPADVGQRDTDPFTVLRDPESNEFCILHP